MSTGRPDGQCNAENFESEIAHGIDALLGTTVSGSIRISTSNFNVCAYCEPKRVGNIVVWS